MRSRLQWVRCTGWIKKCITGVLAVSVGVSLVGCGEEKKEKKPVPKKAAEVDHGTTNASKSGDGQSDAPFIIAVDQLTGNFNPFSVTEEADQTVVDLTQAKLIQADRTGKAVYHGVNGEFSEYGGEHYTYYGAADLKVRFRKKANETIYRIKLRDDLVFSDREVLNADDVIFTLYALCDKSYDGDSILRDMPIKGLLNYQANSTKAEKYSEKKVKAYLDSQPEKLEKWIETNIIKKELERGYSDCEKNYVLAGYETKYAYFTDKYHVRGASEVIDRDTLVKKAFRYYREKGYRVLARDAHVRANYFDDLVKRQARIYMAQGKGKKVSSIAGIVRVGDYELKITTTGYQRKMTGALEIPICPLHYYGNKEQYRYEKNQFGFKRGDISAVKANKAMPLGAGAYRYVKLEDGVAYFTSNELYFLGCPKTAYVHVKEMSDILIETRQQIRQKQANQLPDGNPGQEKTDASASPDGMPDQTPEPTVNPSAELTELTQGTVDVIGATFYGDELQWITGMNSNGEVSGKTVESRFISDGDYFYLGIHGTNVSVGKEPQGDASKALRKAIASVFSVSRQALVDKHGDAVVIPDYPALKESWTVPMEQEEAYEPAYNISREGEWIYDVAEEQEERVEQVIEEALLYLEKAGFKVEGDRVTQAPEGVPDAYELLLPAGKENLCYPMVETAIRILDDMGITIRVKKVAGEAALQRKLRTGKQELWLSCRNGSEVEISERYAGKQAEKLFGITDADLEEGIEKLQEYLPLQDRRELYQKCYQMIFENAVEVPVGEFRSAVLYHSAGMVRNTIPKDLSLTYRPVREIQKIEMK